MATPAFLIDDIRFGERDVALRLPFRFGVATVTSCPQVYVLARIRFADGSTSEGCAAEMMIPKWFDKNTSLTNEQNFEQLRQALQLARGAYTAGNDALSAFGHFAENYEQVIKAGAALKLNPLVTSYGPALVDRAVLDALCLHLGKSFAEAMRTNLPGVDATAVVPDMGGFDMQQFLAARHAGASIAARHTVGLVDAICQADAPEDAPRDGLPVSLEGAVAHYGHTHFKLKLSGNTQADIARMAEIASVIGERAELVTLDGNEQYADGDAFAEFFRAWHSEASLATLARKTVFVEQPIRRDQALARDVKSLAALTPLLIDESDATLESFTQAKTLGYTGVSSKSCKGFYKSVINAARCAKWNAEAGAQNFFLSGEDLTMQAGVGVQQDLALVSLLGLTHVERNGHHYVNGMAAIGEEEQATFLADHATLYEHSHGATRLRIEAGRINLSSLACPGFATARKGAGIDWNAMRSVY